MSLNTIIVFASTAALVFCLGDAIMIPLVMRPLFKAALGAQMLDELRLGPSAIFYLVHIGGLVWFAGMPVLHGGRHANAFINGAVLGLVTYSCYEMTSFTIMRDWTLQLVVIDLAWGTVISGIAAWSGAVAARRFSAP